MKCCDEYCDNSMIMRSQGCRFDGVVVIIPVLHSVGTGGRRFDPGSNHFCMFLICPLIIFTGPCLGIPHRNDRRLCIHERIVSRFPETRMLNVKAREVDGANVDMTPRGGGYQFRVQWNSGSHCARAPPSIGAFPLFSLCLFFVSSPQLTSISASDRPSTLYIQLNF